MILANRTLTFEVPAAVLQAALNLNRERDRHLAGSAARCEASRQRRAKDRARERRASRQLKYWAGIRSEGVRYDA